MPHFDVAGFTFQQDVPGEPVPPIPGVIVIPGNIAFLHSFFDVQLLIANVTPAGSQLVITGAAATLELPLGDNGVAERDPRHPTPCHLTWLPCLPMGRERGHRFVAYDETQRGAAPREKIRPYPKRQRW